MFKPGEKISQEELEKLVNSGEGKITEELKPATTIISEEQEVIDNLKSLNPGKLENVSCPCCGWLLSQPIEVSPTKEDIDNFVIAILSGARFTKTYSIFGNKVRVTLRSRLAVETDLIIEQLNAEKIGKILNSQHLAAVLIKYQLAACLATIQYSDSEVIRFIPVVNADGTIHPEYVDKDIPAIVKAANTNFSKWNDALYNACLKVQTQFEQLITVLTSRATDPNFW